MQPGPRNFGKYMRKFLKIKLVVWKTSTFYTKLILSKKNTEKLTIFLIFSEEKILFSGL